MICGRCGTANRPERKFCLRCGHALLGACPSCGAVNEPEASFCGECGTRLPAPAEAAAPAEPEPAAPVSERRLVAVLFVDLVGFTTRSEHLDAEDARDVLSRYFETARGIVARYGGEVEKFIGDAVMAVWGAPTAHEDDAERAVRAALDLVAAVGSVRVDDGPPLAARAAVMTGETAVTIGASGQGMVAGDLVNSAARLQSVAEPGTVLVDEPTMRAASRAIAFAPLGERALRGRQTPVGAWQALTVVGLVGGSGRRDATEPPFVGRDAELSALKERLHATSADGRARLISITGVAGIGKSRLIWELEKYVDGIVERVYWHHGRSLAYGEGIAFWALGEMVRRRAGIAERDDPATTDEKLVATVAEFVADAEDRRWILPRLRGLLGLEDSGGSGRDELFAAWRRFFEAVAARGTAVLVFEDLQWADDGLIEFIDTLMDWSRVHPILIVTLARPELFERRPSWGAGQRDFTSLHLEPLPRPAMTALVEGLGGGLPATMVETIVARSEGVPLYAVELFRMQQDRGRLQRDEGGFRLVAGGELDVPETLQSLIAARLDGLPPAERRLVQDASVLGQTFTLEALAAVTAEPAEQLEPMLRGLVRRELLEIDRDPRSPERGQYGFIGGLVREVAYATLARRDRRARHLAAARHFESLGDDELAGVLANHYVSAYATSQAGPEAEAVGAQARLALRGAAERALAVASPDAAVTYLRQALEVTADPGEVARLHEDIAHTALRAAQWPVAEAFADSGLHAYEGLGDPRGIARLSSVRGNILFFQGRIEASIELLARALAGLEDSDPDLALELHRQLARAQLFAARPLPALEYIDRGLAAASTLDNLDAIGDLLISRGWAHSLLGRLREGLAETRGALEFGRLHGLTGVQLRAANNLATFLLDDDPAEAVRVGDEAMELAERVGDRDNLQKLAFVAIAKTWGGDWAGADALVERWLHSDAPNLDYLSLASTRAMMRAWSGRDDEARALLVEIRERARPSESHQDAFGVAITEHALAVAFGDDAAIRSAARGLIDADRTIGGTGWEGIAGDGIAAARMGDLAGARARLAELAALRPRLQPGVAMRPLLEAALLAREGRLREAVTAYRDGLDRLRRIGMLLQAMIGGLHAVESLGPDEPLVTEVAAEIRSFVARTGAIGLERRLEAALARPRPAPPVTGPDQRPAPADAPQNVRTTS